MAIFGRIGAVVLAAAALVLWLAGSARAMHGLELRPAAEAQRATRSVTVGGRRYRVLVEPRLPAVHDGCRLSTRPRAPLAVAALFIRTAVERSRTQAAYRLSAPSIRQGDSCRSWASGNVAVVPVLGVDWRLVVIEPVAALDDPRHVYYLVTLASRGRPGAYRFELGLAKIHGSWYVDYWSPYEHVGAAR